MPIQTGIKTWAETSAATCSSLCVSPLSSEILLALSLIVPELRRQDLDTILPQCKGQEK